MVKKGHVILNKIFGFLTLAFLVTGAQAQTFESNNNVFETPMGMIDVREIDGPVSSKRDDRFNSYETASPGWSFSVTAIGNLISVQNNGSNNSVVINATQINNGSQQASINLGSDQFSEQSK